MQTSPREFFVAGGTLQPDAPSYIERQADQELYARVLAGDFCYVLTTRQMGKSSLMARTAKRLREHGVQTAIVDLTQIGTEKEKQSADRWYYGISHRIVRELGLNVKLNEWWNERQNLPALQRLTEFFSDLVLANTADRVAIFVDEIDSTISLPFTDDFFAAIRACHNARATEPAYQRLSFVLFGVASPSDLMKDPQRTPFNIGHRIDLTDFTFDEARPLAQGLSVDSQRGEQALQRVLYWTNGHPYLTQKLCRTILEENLNDGADGEIDRLIDKHFLAPEANRQEYNLNFVRDRLTGDRRASRPLLKVYRRIRQKQRVVDNPLSPVHTVLKLSGLVVPREERRLAVRNRIYEQVFTPDWVQRVMPADWNRRIAVASSLMLLLAIGAWYLVLQARPYIGEIARANDDVPNVPYQNLRALPFYQGKADALMAAYWDRRALRAEQQQQRDESLLYLLRAATFHTTATRRQEAGHLIGDDYPNLLATYRHREAILTAVALSPDGEKVLTSSSDGTVRLWSAQTGAVLGESMRHNGEVWAMAFSPDGQKVVTGSEDSTARLWSAKTATALGEPMRHQSAVYAVAFSPDGEKVLTGSFDGTARLWSVKTAAAMGESMRHNGFVSAVAFSADGEKVLTGSSDGTARLWSVKTSAAMGEPMRHQSAVYVVTFSPDGEKVLTGSFDGAARLWSVKTAATLGAPMRHERSVNAVAFSPDGEKVLTGSRDGTARLWSASTGAALDVPMRYQGRVVAVALSPDGEKVLTGSADGIARLWSVKTRTALSEPMRHEGRVVAVAFSPNGEKVLTGSADGIAQLWSVKTSAALDEPIRHQGDVVVVAFSPNGEKVLTGSSDGTLRLWSATTGAALGEPMRHQDGVLTVTFSPDGEKVLTGSYGGTARLWSVKTSAALGEPMRHQGDVVAVAFSPDGEKVLTGSYRGTAQLWSVKTGAALGEPMHHINFAHSPVVAVAFSPDGQRVLTGSWDNTARLWSAKTGVALSEPMRHESSVVTVAFSPDGKSLMAATDWWVHLSSVVSDTTTPEPKASRLLSGTWTGAYRFFDPSGNQMQVAVHTTGNAIKIDTLRFDIPNAPPIQGDPKTLLKEWQNKLALKFDENGKIVPMYLVEAAREAVEPRPR
jgi:WD40 repeat protein